MCKHGGYGHFGRIPSIYFLFIYCEGIFNIGYIASLSDVFNRSLKYRNYKYYFRDIRSMSLIIPRFCVSFLICRTILFYSKFISKFVFGGQLFRQDIIHYNRNCISKRILGANCKLFSLEYASLICFKPHQGINTELRLIVFYEMFFLIYGVIPYQRWRNATATDVSFVWCVYTPMP